MPSAEAPLVEARGLVRRYGAVRALNGVDLVLGAGEVLLVLGPNGAGKTTLLRTLAGLLRPQAGNVTVAGRPLSRDDPAARRPIGLLSHQSLLYDELSLLENLTLAARLYDLPDPPRRAALALEAQGLASRQHDRPRSLSRGMQQRAAIARALLHDPRLLLLDEPFTGLDAVAADRLRSLLETHRTPERAMVIVTHHAAEAWDLATRVGVLVGGRWVLEAPRPGDPVEFHLAYQELARG
ncbi:MAG TPA: heme ABC exporter ATP-binding protein CcmA [Gemmatimonadales bacterium]|jgi:heme ABC exporter ATP-binding subunit CcmA